MRTFWALTRSWLLVMLLAVAAIAQQSGAARVHVALPHVQLVASVGESCAETPGNDANWSLSENGFAGELRCIAGVWLTTRGELAPDCLVGPRATRPIDDAYDMGECVGRAKENTLWAESVGQARAIALLSPPAIDVHEQGGGISPDWQWEVTYPGSGKQPDMVVYNHEDKGNSEPVQIIEARVVDHRPQSRWQQVDADLKWYVDNFPTGHAQRYVFPPAWSDEFKIRVGACNNGRERFVKWFFALERGGVIV